jgi:hypothetical protein
MYMIKYIETTGLMCQALHVVIYNIAYWVMLDKPFSKEFAIFLRDSAFLCACLRTSKIEAFIYEPYYGRNLNS